MPHALALYDWYLVGYVDGLLKASGPQQPSGSSSITDTAARLAFVLGMKAGAAAAEPATKSDVERMVATLNR